MKPKKKPVYKDFSLRDCPFCGGDPEYTYANTPTKFFSTKHTIRCKNSECEALLEGDSFIQVKKRWNHKFQKKISLTYDLKGKKVSWPS